MTTHTVRSLLQVTQLDNVDAKLLMAAALGWSRVQMITQDRDTLRAEQVQAWQLFEQRRLAGEPVAYLLGHREFYGLTFKVTPAVLIPRPDTELLVDLALSKLETSIEKRVLDLGTGSGAIAVAIASQCPTAQVTATDFSQEALEVAQGNAQTLLSAANAVRFKQGSWYEALTTVDGLFDVIVSNPPYIQAQDTHLSQGDLRYEPMCALTDYADGLQALRSIVQGAHALLKPNGWLMMEHGYDQAEQVQALLRAAGFEKVFSSPDLAGILRVTGGQITA